MAQSNAFLPSWGAGFDPTQTVNKYSPFQGVGIPWPSQYAGPATDARGNVIQSYADAAKQPTVTTYSPIGTGLASTSTPGDGFRASNPYNMPDNDMQLAAMLDPNGFGSTPFAQSQMQNYYQMHGGQPAAPTPAPVATTTGPDMNAAYLAALRNPGPVTTPGANVTPGPLPAQQGSVLTQFLNNWSGRGTGAGGYDNQPFFKALKNNDRTWGGGVAGGAPSSTGSGTGW